MKQYFTTLDLIDEKYIGTVYSSATNQAVYKTAPHFTQSQAVQDINNFLAGGSETKKEITSETITNTTSFKPIEGRAPTRKCCGR
jgi:hypothetical protein